LIPCKNRIILGNCRKISFLIIFLLLAFNWVFSGFDPLPSWKRPIAAFGNSDGYLQMFKYATTGKGKSLEMLIHHADSVRE